MHAVILCTENCKEPPQGFFCPVCHCEGGEALPSQQVGDSRMPMKSVVTEQCLAFGGCWCQMLSEGLAGRWGTLVAGPVRAELWFSSLQFPELDVVKAPSLRSCQYVDAPNTDLKHKLYN